MQSNVSDSFVCISYNTDSQYVIQEFRIEVQGACGVSRNDLSSLLVKPQFYGLKIFCDPVIDEALFKFREKFLCDILVHQKHFFSIAD